MKIKAGSFCPLIKKDCIELKCAWFTQLRGHNPNTGEEVDDWGCAVGWLPVLLVENSQQQRSTGAAVESFRNEMVKSNEKSVEVLKQAAGLELVADATRKVN
tara:strand:+ start:303 stop:608 length:306 start_codon:yes stop_codon:yes gene_type:complete